MAQQMIPGYSNYQGSKTITNRMTDRYAVVSPYMSGKHRKPQTSDALEKRHQHWLKRNEALTKQASKKSSRRAKSR